MSNLTTLTGVQFKRALKLSSQLEKLNRKFSALLTEAAGRAAAGPEGPKRGRKPGKLGAKGLARLSATQQERSAKISAAKNGAAKNGKAKVAVAVAAEENESETKPKRMMSAAARARIAAGAKAR